MTDEPIAYTKDGRPLFDNTPTVVSVVARHGLRLITVRRNNDPSSGLIGLPGGYHMRGETWQQAGAREMWEETGYIIDPDFLSLRSCETDEYGNNLIICEGVAPTTLDPKFVLSDEVQEVVLTRIGDMNPKEWAFPRHLAAALGVFGGCNV